MTKAPLPIALIFLSGSAPFCGAAELPTYDCGNPTAHEQLMLELVNRARTNPSAEAARLGIGLNDGLAPGTIDTQPKPPLALHPALIAAARAHTGWMLANEVFSHTGTGGSTSHDRMVAAGFDFSGSWSSGENIALGQTTGTVSLTSQTIARHDSLFRSAVHRVNICGTATNRIGLGIISGEFDGWNAVMVTQDFAGSGAYPETLVTGVVYEDKNGDGFYDPGEGIPGVVVKPEGGDWQAKSSSSGGYAVPYSGASGTLTVLFQGDIPNGTRTLAVQKSGENLKLDLVVDPSMKPEIAVRNPKSGNLVDGKSLRDFGAAAKNKKGMVRTFTIANTGKALLTDLRISIKGFNAGDFLVSPAKTADLPPGGTTRFSVTFRPKGIGTRHAVLRIRSNDDDENPFDIRLTGRGRK